MQVVGIGLFFFFFCVCAGWQFRYQNDADESCSSLLDVPHAVLVAGDVVGMVLVGRFERARDREALVLRLDLQIRRRVAWVWEKQAINKWKFIE